MHLVDGIADCRYLELNSSRLYHLETWFWGKRSSSCSRADVICFVALHFLHQHLHQHPPHRQFHLTPIFLPLGDTNGYTQPGKL